MIDPQTVFEKDLQDPRAIARITFSVHGEGEGVHVCPVLKKNLNNSHIATPDGDDERRLGPENGVHVLALLDHGFNLEGGLMPTGL
jgi:hypothetical protein